MEKFNSENQHQMSMGGMDGYSFKFEEPDEDQDFLSTPDYVKYADFREGDFNDPNISSVNLDERRLALEALMGYFNQLNKFKGFSSDSGRKTARDTYDNQTLNRIDKNIIQNVPEIRAKIDIEVNKLMGGDKFADDNIDEKNSLKSDLYSSFGPGKAYKHHRDELIKSLYVPKPKKDDSKQK